MARRRRNREVHPKLSRRQRQLDLQILVENVAMGMIDLAERLGRPPQLHDTLIRKPKTLRFGMTPCGG